MFNYPIYTHLSCLTLNESSSSQVDESSDISTFRYEYWFSSSGGYTIMNAKFSEKGGLRFMELQCKVNIRKVKKKVELVKEFYFFYQPEEDWPNARVILAGLVRDKGLWVDPYRIRMFPQLRILLDKHKGMIWRGSEGSGRCFCVLEW